MHRRITGALVVVTAAAVMLTLRHTVAAQTSDLAGARVSHVGVVVTDIDATLRQYVRVMGFKPVTVNAYPAPMPDGRKAEIKLATLRMTNFFIELIQPTNADGPYAEHLRTHGMSIQHVGLSVPGTGSVDDLRSGFEQKGGRWTLGTKGGNFAYVNFQPTFGTTFELLRGSGAAGEPPALPAGDALPVLGALPVSHIGFATTDTAAFVSGFASLLGGTAPKVMDYKDAQYPPETKWNRDAYLRLAMLNQGGMGVEVIESVGGPTPWSEFVRQQKGTAAQHVAINVGDRMDEMIRDLVAKGGTWINGKAGGRYAYLDFMDTLGLVFELDGTSKSAGK